MTYGKTKSTSGHDSRPFALQQNNIDKHITNRLHYFKNLQKQLDAQATKKYNKYYWCYTRCNRRCSCI